MSNETEGSECANITHKTDAENDGIGFMFSANDEDAIEALVSAWAKKYDMPKD